MGIPGLIAFLRKKAPLAFKRATAADLHGKIIGIDLSITLYRGAATAYKNGALSHLETLAREVGWLLGHGCTPVYVIDGEAPLEKAEEAQKREDGKRAAEKHLEELLSRLEKSPGDGTLLDAVQKLQRQSFRVTSQMRVDAKSLLEGMGVSFVTAPGEAERCLAHLLRSGVVEMAFTEDVDVLVCGAHSYVKNSGSLMYEMESGSPTDGRLFAEHVSLQGVLEGLQISYEGFVTMSVLAGCDFAPKLQRFGPATAWKHVSRFSEDMDACFDNLKIEDQVWRERYKKAASLLRYDEEAVWPEVVSAVPSCALLEGLYARLRSESSLAVLRAYVDRTLPESDASADASERPTKRLRQS
jgi:flap endonuclease-1